MLLIFAYSSLDMFIGIPLTIHLSRFPKMEISYNALRRNFSIGENEHDFVKNAKFYKHGTLYAVEISNERLCVKNKKISTDGECYWDLLRYPFGYIIRNRDYCLTLKDKLRILPCHFHKPLDTQLFSFKIVRECLKNSDIYEKADADKKEFEEISKKYGLNNKPKIKKLIKKLHNLRKKKSKVPRGSFRFWKGLFC